jgi:hypothetical protein
MSPPAWVAHFSSARGVPSLQLVATRAAFQQVVVVSCILASDVTFLPPREAMRPVLLRGVVGGLSFMGYFHAMTVLKLGDAITLMSLYPVFSVFMGWCVRLCVCVCLCAFVCACVRRWSRIDTAWLPVYESGVPALGCCRHGWFACSLLLSVFFSHERLLTKQNTTSSLHD